MEKERVTNQAIAEVLREIGEYLAMQEVPFKPRAYEKAALAIADSEADVAEEYAKGGMKALKEIPGVGASIAEKIEEFIKTGKVKYYEQLKRKTPVDLESMSRVEGLGPKTVKLLYQKLDIRNLDELTEAAKAGKLAGLPGFGEKKQEKILKSIGFATSSANQRFILGYTLPQVRKIQERLEAIPGAEKVTIAGSARRKRDTIGDADILAVAKTPAAIMKSFISMPEVVDVIAHGETKSSVKLSSGLNVDLRVVPRESYGAALNYFTGSKDHNVALRKIAVAKKWKLNEYGLFKVGAANGKGGKSGAEGKKIAGETEEGLYEMFGMDYIEPELRENTGELAAAREHKLPKLIGYDELQGDLQTQTTWTDGADSIEAMAKAAQAKGLKYIVITDHSKRLAMAHGLDEKRLAEQGKEIDKLNQAFGGKFKILKGIECDILKDGTLDLEDSALAKLDVVGVSVHSHFNLPRAEQTARVLRAIQSPHADIFFHPTGRIINRREPIDVDMDEVIKVAKKTGTVMEINSFPERADLKDEFIRKCVDSGVKLSVDSDAHSVKHFAFLEFGISQARRGWAERKDVINAWPAEKMLQYLKR